MVVIFRMLQNIKSGFCRQNPAMVWHAAAFGNFLVNWTANFYFEGHLKIMLNN